MRSHYKAIYDAATNNDASSLQEAIKCTSINTFKVVSVPEQKLAALVISPICQLAIENNQKAVHFLLEQGANRNEVVLGYAIGGHTTHVQTQLERGANRDVAVLGYAIGGYTVHVQTLLEQGASQDVAVQGYATSGDTAQVQMLLKQGVNRDTAVFGYASGGHTAQVQNLLKQGANRDAAVQGYAISGHIAQVEALLEQGANRDTAVFGYAIGGHTAQVEALLEQGANRDMAVLGYAVGGHFTSIDLLLKVDLFKEINKLEVHGRSLQNQGSPQKGQKAMLLAKQIHEEVYQFLLGHQEKEATSNKISKMITDGKRSMGECRNTKDIIAHIVFALTGIGLIIILGKKFLTASQSGFLNATKRQEITNNIEKETKKIFQP